QPRSQSDSARNGIDLSDRVAGLGQNQIRPNNERDVVAKLFLAGELDQISRFSGVEILRDPARLFAFDAALIQLVAGALKNVKAMAELFEFLGEFVVDWKRIRGKKKIFFGEKAFVGESIPDQSELVGVGGHWQQTKC